MQSPFAVRFDYHSEGIFVSCNGKKGEYFPVLLMEWVKGETLGLEDLAFALPLTIADIKKVQGTIDFQANVTGTTKDPKADVTLTGNGLIYNTYALGSIEAKATYENRIAHIP